MRSHKNMVKNILKIFYTFFITALRNSICILLSTLFFDILTDK